MNVLIAYQSIFNFLTHPYSLPPPQVKGIIEINPMINISWFHILSVASYVLQNRRNSMKTVKVMECLTLNMFNTMIAVCLSLWNVWFCVGCRILLTIRNFYGFLDLYWGPTLARFLSPSLFHPPILSLIVTVPMSMK